MKDLVPRGRGPLPEMPATSTLLPPIFSPVESSQRTAGTKGDNVRKALEDQEVGIWLWKVCTGDQAAMEEMAHHGPSLLPNGVMFRSDSGSPESGPAVQQLLQVWISVTIFKLFHLVLGWKDDGEAQTLLSESFQSSGYRKLGKAGLKRHLSKICP